MVLIKVVGNGKTSLKIISGESQLSKIAENGSKMASNDEMVLMKVVQIEKTSIKMVSAKSQLSKIAENGPKMASNDEMVLMKVVRFIDNISLFNLYNFH